MSKIKHFVILILVILSLTILTDINNTPKNIKDDKERDDIEFDTKLYSEFVDFDDDHFLEYFTSSIRDDIFFLDIWSFNGSIRKIYHFEKPLNYSLRQHYSVYFTEVEDKYYLIENDYSYGLAGFEYVSSTIIRKIVDDKIVIAHDLLEKTTVDVSAFEGDSEQFEQGSINNPISYFDFNLEIDTFKYLEILNQYYNTDSIKTLLEI